MKIAVVGKGGVGKTTFVAVLARLLAREGFDVIAIDADPSLNLALALGFPRHQLDKIPVLFNEEEFIRSRTELPGGLINLTPRVDDVVEKFGVVGPDGVKLLVLGTVKRGGTRCLCPENAFLRALLSHLILKRREVVVIDMAAGLEHMSRGTARGVDLMLCITEPNLKSIDVTLRMYRLSKDINVRNFAVVGNKIANEEDVKLIEDSLKGLEILGYIPFDEDVLRADSYGIPILDFNPRSRIVESIAKIKEVIISKYYLHRGS